MHALVPTTRCRLRVPGLMPEEGGQGQSDPMLLYLYSEIKCIMDNGNIGLLPNGMADRDDLKHYLRATLLARGNKDIHQTVKTTSRQNSKVNWHIR